MYPPGNKLLNWYATMANNVLQGGAIANTLVALRSRHPYLDRPVIDMEIILMMEPATIVGAMIGSFANKLLPSIAISIMLVVVLSLMAHRTLKRGLKHFRKEAAMKALRSATLSSDLTVGLLSEQDSSTSLGSQDCPSSSSSSSSTDSAGTAGKSPRAEQQLSPLTSSSSSGSSCPVDEPKLAPQGTPEAIAIAEGERFIPLWKPFTLVICFLGVVVIDVLKGGDGMSLLGFSCGSLLYWVTTLSVIPWVGMFFLYFRHQLLSNYRRKVTAGYR